MRPNIDEAFLIDKFMGATHPTGAVMYTSWNDLMDVVEKIETIYDPHHGHFICHISSNSCDIQGTYLHRALQDSTYGWVYISDPNAILETKRESTRYNVIEFIRWYTQTFKI